MELPKFSVTRPLKSLNTKGLHCQVLPIKTLSKGVNGKWPRASKLHLGEQIKELKKNLKPETTDLQAQLSFDAGGQWVGLFVSDSIKTYDLHNAIRKAFEASVKKRAGEKILLSIDGLSRELQSRVLGAFASLTVLAPWAPNRYGKKAKEKTKAVAGVSVVTSLDSKEVKKIIDEGVVLAEGNNLVRSLGYIPSNVLTPSNYLAEIQKRAKVGQYKVEFFDRKSLTKMGAGAFLAVTQGSLEEEGGIAHLHVPGRSRKKKLVLVGKGLCFDTGGYNIKTGVYMYGMHKDMLGSAVALALFETILELDLDVEVHAYLALAENLISTKSYRPNDVVTALDGTTIEVIDTDAEGRMVLSDTLALARKQKPDLVMDFATLTGAAVRALDTRRGALFSTRDDLAKLGFEAGEASGERCWNFPMGEDYNETLKSEIADLMQCASKN